ncbi:hypothetical protein SAMN02910292_00580 [Lachnospiraceae bacterium XBB2008]|nr:hypothetical protein SAMN02910292_00580 [Lachnospiraceae bacterium XBB2008]
MCELALYSSNYGVIVNLIKQKLSYNTINGIDRLLISKYELVLQSCSSRYPQYVYFGNSFCQYKMPGLQELKAMIDFCEQEDLKFVLVTPPLSAYGASLCKVFLEHFIAINAEFEIVINDFGMLKLINDMKYPGKVILGRLLDKTVRDYRITDLEEQNYYTEKGFDYFSSLASTSDSFSGFLIENNITRIEYDCSQHIYKGNGLFRYDFIFPTEYITTGRICLFGLLERDDASLFDLDNSCTKQCNKVIQVLSHPISYPKRNLLGERIRNTTAIRCGNTVYNINNELNMGEYVDRIIFDADLLSPPNVISAGHGFHQ